MKYLYQQLLAFWTLIIVILLIVGFSFTQLTKRSLEEKNYEELNGYLQSIVQTAEVLRDRYGVADLKTVLDVTKNTLETQDVDFLFMNTNQEIEYPISTHSGDRVSVTLSDAEWEKIKDGQALSKTLDVDIYGKEETTSYVFRSIISNKVQFAGVLLITQPAKNLDQSIDSLTSNLIKGFVVSAIIAVILSYYLARFSAKRISQMKDATRQIAEGNFEVELPNNNDDEFDELAQDFNHMAKSLKESNEEIERQEEKRNQFMADASHEMRTPLTTIKGLLEGLQYNAIPENQKEHAIKLMQNETERLIRLVNENLDYEKIRANQITIVVKRFNATQTFRDLFTQLEGKAADANDKLELIAAEEIDVYADYDRFVQIMVNILQNAIQFTTNGVITVTVEKGDLETIIQITDTGLGMDEEQLSNIWERYYKADPSRKNTKGESGLGLSIVKQLVRLHKGTIHADSELGKGTTFRITFPDIELQEGGSLEDEQGENNTAELAEGQVPSEAEEAKAESDAEHDENKAEDAEELDAEAGEAGEEAEEKSAEDPAESEDEFPDSEEKE